MTQRRRSWSLEEDDAINNAVAQCGTNKWVLVARTLENHFGVKGRTGKQCRERWRNHLAPLVNKQPWSEIEEHILFEAQQQYGNKWSAISKQLPGRTDNCVKNHFYSTLRRRLRKHNKAWGTGLALNPDLTALLLSYKEAPRKLSGEGKTRASERLQNKVEPNMLIDLFQPVNGTAHLKCLP